MSTEGSEEMTDMVLIHGAWLSARSWERFAEYFTERGYSVETPEWPRKHGDVEERRPPTSGTGARDRPDLLPGRACELRVELAGRARQRLSGPDEAAIGAHSE
jgi:hypothetical protein